MARIRIHTAAGPVEPATPFKCLIVESEDREFILGKDILSALGIDIDRQLKQLAARQSGDDDGDPFDSDSEGPRTLNDGEGNGALAVETKIGALFGAVIDGDARTAVEKMIQRALDNGFPQAKIEKLREVACLYGAWRLELCADPPAKVEPLSIRLKPDASPHHCKLRKHPRQIREFLAEFNEKLVQLGYVIRNKNSTWASAVLPVRKSPAAADLRQTVDYRRVNAMTEAIVPVMPTISLAVEQASGKEHFGLFDFLKGFWQLPLSEACSEVLSYMTDCEVFTPLRVPQGCSDAAAYFQKTMETVFAPLLHTHLLIWIDDLLLSADDIDTYIEKLKEFFTLLDTFGLKLSAKKSSLYQRDVEWCGKLIDKDGVRHDPERIATLQTIPYPTNAGQLQQFICAANWMRDSLVDYARHISLLQNKLDIALAKTKRTKRVAAGIQIELNASERTAFDSVKALLSTSAALPFPNGTDTTCLFTDASDYGWALIVTQVKNYDPKVPAHQQLHRLLACMSGTFSGPQLNWMVIEKEAFPIIVASEKLDYLLLRPQGFRMFCGHRNLIHVFAPSKEIKKHTQGKLLR